MIFSLHINSDQRLELTKNEGDSEPVRGQIVVSLMTRDGRGLTSPPVNDSSTNFAFPGDLPEVLFFWELCFTCRTF